MKRGRREDFDPPDGSWAFEVPDCFRDQLDIKYGQFVDREASKELRKKCPKDEDGKPPTVYRMAWSQGDPPMLSFDIGHVFYDVPGVRRMAWGEALKVLRRVVQVREAKPDGEADDSGTVKFDTYYYDAGTRSRTEKRTMSQADFLCFLQTGNP